MADNAWAEITIGGNLIAEKVGDLTKILNNECGYLLEEDKTLNDHLYQGNLYFENSEAANGEFKELEEFCKENKLSFIRTSDAFYNWLNSNNRAIITVNTIKEILEVLKSIPTIEEAPLYINENDEKGILSKYLLEHRKVDPVAYMKKRIEDLCPTVPELPPFKIIH